MSAVLATILITMAMSSYFIATTGTFGAIQSGTDTLTAQHYAEIEANKLSGLSYQELDSKINQKTWKKLDNDNNWETKTELTDEQVLDPNLGIKQRIATVSLRKVGTKEEKFQLKIPFSSDITKATNNSEEIWDEPEIFFPEEKNYNGHNFEYVADGEKHYFIFKRAGLLISFTTNFIDPYKPYCIKKGNICLFNSNFGDTSIPVQKGERIDISGDLKKVNAQFGLKPSLPTHEIMAINRIVFFPIL